MDKPSTVLHREFVDRLQELVNTSYLPAFVLVPILRDALAQLEKLEEQQYQHDYAEWNKNKVEKSKSEENANGRQKD